MSQQRLRWLLGAGLGAGLASAGGLARADETAPDTEVFASPPPPRLAYIQYGVAFTVEGVAFAGPVCAGADASRPCILGSGGGIDIRVGWRPSEAFYIGGAYEFSKQDPNKLFRLAISAASAGRGTSLLSDGQERGTFRAVRCRGRGLRKRVDGRDVGTFRHARRGGGARVVGRLAPLRVAGLPPRFLAILRGHDPYHARSWSRSLHHPRGRPRGAGYVLSVLWSGAVPPRKAAAASGQTLTVAWLPLSHPFA